VPPTLRERSRSSSSTAAGKGSPSTMAPDVRANQLDNTHKHDTEHVQCTTVQIAQMALITGDA
jgi:hypothetical protein